MVSRKTLSALATGVLVLTLHQFPAEAQEQNAGADGVDASTMAKANNPLADMNAVNFHNYHRTSLYGVPNVTDNELDLRGIMVTGRHIIRATLPVKTVPTGLSSTVSGLGDLNVFDAIVVTSPEAPTMLGVGPLLVMPTATDDALGAPRTWQAGLAAIVVKPLEGGSLIGGLLTWQTGIAGGDQRVNTSVMAAQYFLTMSVGGGWYLRSTPLAVLDFENDVSGSAGTRCRQGAAFGWSDRERLRGTPGDRLPPGGRCPRLSGLCRA